MSSEVEESCEDIISHDPRTFTYKENNRDIGG